MAYYWFNEESFLSFMASVTLSRSAEYFGAHILLIRVCSVWIKFAPRRGAMGRGEVSVALMDILLLPAVSELFKPRRPPAARWGPHSRRLPDRLDLLAASCCFSPHSNWFNHNLLFLYTETLKTGFGVYSFLCTARPSARLGVDEPVSMPISKCSCYKSK